MPKATPRTTQLFILATAVIWVAYDAYAAATGGGVATESWQLYVMAVRWPIIPFGVGVLIGHLYASQSRIRVVTPDETAIPDEARPD